MGPALRRDLGHPGVLDADLFAQLGAFLPQLFHLCGQAQPPLGVVGGCTVGVQDGETRQGEGVKGGGFHTAPPAAGERNPESRLFREHHNLRKSPDCWTPEVTTCPYHSTHCSREA